MYIVRGKDDIIAHLRLDREFYILKHISSKIVDTR